MAIDHTELVEAPKDQKTLQFPDEKQQANFELAVSMAVHAWEDLLTAVDNQWGGPNSSEKRDWISSIVVDLFTTERAVDVALVEETLLYAMVDEFDTEIDDDLALAVAKRVIDFYKQCRDKNYEHVREAYDRWVKRQEQAAKNVTKVVVGEDPNNPDATDDEEDEEDENVPALVEAVQEDAEMVDADKQEPVVDGDGFELVQKKGKKGRR